jgi:hypothetical protein
LIEFIGIQWDSKKQSAGVFNKHPSDVWIRCFDGGRLLEHTTREGEFLAGIWKGCTQASSHPTDGSHPSVNDKVLPEAIKIVVDHLQNTIYHEAGTNIRDYVLTKP